MAKTTTAIGERGHYDPNDPKYPTFNEQQALAPTSLDENPNFDLDEIANEISKKIQDSKIKPDKSHDTSKYGEERYGKELLDSKSLINKRDYRPLKKSYLKG